MKHLRFTFAVIMPALVVNAQTSVFPTHRFPTTAQQAELHTLTERGVNYRFVDQYLVELTDSVSSTKYTKTLGEPDEMDIRSWAEHRGIPILEIDPNMIDTSVYSGWYIPWKEIPLSNNTGWPLLVGDVNGNRKMEVYGIHKAYDGTYYSRVYEIDTLGTVDLIHEYGLSRGPSFMLRDLDNDGLTEVIFQLGDSIIDYEQSSLSGLPVVPQFTFAMWEYPGTAILTHVQMADLNNNDLIDFLYRGSEIDSSTPSGFRYGTYISEFDPALQNFRHVWSRELIPDGEAGVGGYDVGDYDGDNHQEFLASGTSGQVWVYENRDSNDYQLSFHDSLPFVNLYYQTSGDVDHDGHREFFVGATMSSGNWTTMYETDGDDHFAPRFIFHLMSGGTFDEPTYLCEDIDNDGPLELMIASGGDLFFFKSRAEDQYYLSFYKKVIYRNSIQISDLNKDGLKDLLVSKSTLDGLGRRRFFAETYLGTPLSEVNPDRRQLPAFTVAVQNYPNPFNPTTVLQFDLSEPGTVSLAVYDLLGRKVADLASGYHQAGYYPIVWNAANMASGVYLARFTVVNDLGNAVYTKINKLVLMK